MGHLIRKQSTAVVILAGGKATRLGQIARNIPKAMIRFDGHPLLEYLTTHYIKNGFAPVVISVGVLGEVIQNYFAMPAWRGAPIVINFDTELQGTAAALQLATATLRADHVIVANGDTVVDMSVHRMVESHMRNNHLATLALTRIAGVPNEGAFYVSKDNKVLSSHEARDPRTRLPKTEDAVSWRGSSTGVMIFRRDYLVARLTADDPRARPDPVDDYSIESDFLPALIRRGDLRAFDNGLRYVLDIGTPERLQRQRQRPDMLSRIYGPPYTLKPTQNTRC